MGENIKNGGLKKVNEPILMYQDASEDMKVHGEITLKRLQKITKKDACLGRIVTRAYTVSRHV